MLNQSDDKLEIELTSKCALQCPACARVTQSDMKQEWDAGHLSKELLFRICDTTNFHRYQFVGCYGDPIYHPDFLEICKYFMAAGKKILVHTNGSAKPEKFWKEAADIVWKGCIFTFSVDGLEDTNHIYRKGSKWKQILTAMKYMASIPRENRPTLEWKFLVFPYNKHQIEEARTLANELGFTKFEAWDSYRNANSYNVPAEELHNYVS
jgi:MoaA/NifB/PqqE/SkfB family radical SAM enzyme